MVGASLLRVQIEHDIRFRGNPLSLILTLSRPSCKPAPLDSTPFSHGGIRLSRRAVIRIFGRGCLPRIRRGKR
eukprot:7338503-Karenia_brevis.AAC.1